MRCGLAWTTGTEFTVIAGFVFRNVPAPRDHVCGMTLDVSIDPPIHWGLHECADDDCDEATSIDVFDPVESGGS